jgi:hypothetical protein
MKLKTLSPKLLISTSTKESISMFSNILISGFLANKLKPDNFLTYTSIIFIVSSATQINRGVQFSVVKSSAHGKFQLSQPSFSLSRIALIESVIWVLISPLIAHTLKLPIVPLLIAGFALPITVCSAWVAGTLQSSQRNSEWQTWLTFSTLLQFPLLGIAIHFDLKMSFLLLCAFLGTFISSCFYIARASKQFFKLRVSPIYFYSPGIFASTLFLNYNLPVLTLRGIVPEGDLGKYTLLTFPFGVLVGFSSIFGSFLLSRSIKNADLYPSGYRIEWRPALLILCLMSACGFLLKQLSPNLIPRTLGPSYSADLNGTDIVVCVLAYSCWAIVYWISQSQMYRINIASNIFQIVILFFEIIVLLFFELTPIAVFLTHLVLGLTALALLIYSMKDSNFLLRNLPRTKTAK